MTELSYAAGSMRTRAIAVRQWLVSTYFAPSMVATTTLSFADLVREAGIRPIEDYQLRLLLSHLPFLLHDGTIETSGVPVVCHFGALVNGEGHKFKVTFPQDIRGTYSASDADLTIKFAQAVEIQFPDDDQLGGLSGVFHIVQIALSDAAIVYSLRAAGGGGGGVISIVLDLTRAQVATQAFVPRHGLRMWAFVFAGGSCSCNGFTAARPGYYVIKNATGCSVKLMAAGETVECASGHGPFDSLAAAQADERSWCGGSRARPQG